MHIDSWLPKYDFKESYSTRIASSPETVFKAMREADLTRSGLIKILFGLRGLSFSWKSRSLRLTDMTKSGFILLQDAPPFEIVLGLVGKFWTPRGGIQRLSAEAYGEFVESGYAKVAWNFFLTPQEGSTLLFTETRIQCLGADAKRSFSRYWKFIKPFSGLTRKEMLRIIKKVAEGSTTVWNK